MISDRDVYASARLLIAKHGDEAPIHAAMNADAMIEKGDMDGRAVWLQILEAVKLPLSIDFRWRTAHRLQPLVRLR